MVYSRAYYTLCLLVITALSSGCMVEQNTRVLGTIDYVGSAEVYLDLPTVHYKYVAPNRIDLLIDGESPARFDQTVDIDSAQIAFLHIGDQSYPIYLVPGNSIELDIRRNDFPDDVKVEGYNRDWNTPLTTYFKEVKSIDSAIMEVREAYLEGESDELIDLYQQRMQLARKYLTDTPFHPLYYKTVGEYLVKRLEFIHRSDVPMEQRPARREAIIREAKSLDFFTATSLKSQRAGIRDFATAFAETHGIQQRLEEQYEQSLTAADVKQLGYRTLDSIRISLLDYIPTRNAEAHARMYFIAERIGEMPLEIARPSYEQYLSDFTEYDAYTAFLQDFYQRRKAVSPGQPAVSFTLPDPDGKLYSMDDFKGRYVLLDFWATWCIPCLDAMEPLRRIHQKYSRDQFEIVAISIEEDSSTWRSALQQFDMPWIQLYGGDGVQQQTFNDYQAGGIPFYILIGPDGTILRYNDVRPSFNLDSVLTRYIDQ